MAATVARRGSTRTVPARRWRARSGALTACALLALAACGSPATSSPAPTVTARADVVADKQAVPAPEVPPTWPLTGVAGTPDPRPAIAVKIENTAVARPQSGLDQADVVWETIVEFEVSRLVAVFHSQAPQEVGPIRSVRPMDPLIVAPLGGMLAFSGGQPGILDLVAASGVQEISHDAGAPGLQRIRTRSAPHNVYGSLSTWWGIAEPGRTAPPEQFGFARSADRAAAATAGSPAATLSFRLSGQSQPVWTWDAASGTWLRSEGSAPATAASGNRLSAVNVVAVTAPHPNTPFGAQGGAPVPTYELVGSGDAVIASGGKTVAARWQKDAQDQPMRLLLPDGSQAQLAPGNTWVELVPAGSGSLTVS
ncbi:DUF3048 domain-containing protein [Cellulomonas dongxiuzhuiae]|uniref:DUF3048 domain-containing protein n=1 Tax=Cellulomonas dongxiuzhuiae TaxID=2819979 RepID=A0ABX8GGQ9_9CELL|nr:DUF3048 domain-containing protein [Cellulomonas dongxiuzhuiae]MBO3094275.1 DUF3048 domain-containing protein [Cellulomonas dongxiuzhuiae]QWC15323.1 DUF3048 domain-containing protein [Cellulomonas dongxiuzhuiae]